ncbi:MAG: hypothetical protein A4E35_00741 [Methanoregula sp. PtaU1.Bin051]|nr:MAG: hypothetical protein A4E35_00741 [Methanoregula sp. PtaU1.Bin051]
MVNLNVPPDEAIRLLNERIEAIGTIKRTPAGLDYYDFVGWCSRTYAAVDRIYGVGDFRPEEIRMIGLFNCSCDAHTRAVIVADAYYAKLQEYIGQIEEAGKGSE